MKLNGGLVKWGGIWRRAAGCLALALMATAGQAHAQSSAPEHFPLLRALNAARLKGCDGHAGPATPLRENTQLSVAAARIAGGSQLDEALQATGYRAMQAAQITLQGYTGPVAVAQGAVDTSCAAVIQGELAEAGFHQRGGQTWIVLAAPFSPPVAAQAEDVQARLLALVNEARARPRRCGNESFAAARPVRLNATLQRIALAHASDMARHNYFSHSGRDGSQVADRASRAGYRWRSIGENIAAGQMNADAVVQGWVESPGHCANLMAPVYTDMGAAFAVNERSKGGIYWVQMFGAVR